MTGTLANVTAEEQLLTANTNANAQANANINANAMTSANAIIKANVNVNTSTELKSSWTVKSIILPVLFKYTLLSIRTHQAHLYKHDKHTYNTMHQVHLARVSAEQSISRTGP